MRVALLRGRCDVEIVDRPNPSARPGTVVVEIDRCGIGGSDVEAFETGVCPAPAWFGHEWVGRVVEIGPGCPDDRFEGERVVGAVPAPCGRCGPCAAGLGAHCETNLELIVGSHPSASEHGAFAERIRVDATRVHRVPDGVDDTSAALAEPGAVAAHAVARAGQRLGDVVVVVGAGTVGLLVAELARLAGASRVAAVDIDPARRERACSFGADAAFAPTDELSRWLRSQSHGLGADVVYDCSRRSAAIPTPLEAVRQGGTVVAVGRGRTIEALDAGTLIDRELTLTGSLGYTVADVHRALDLMADDRFRVSAMCQGIVGFNGLAPTLERQASAPAVPGKILFTPDG